MNDNQNETKICNRCKRELPLDSDHFNHKCDTKDGWASRCKECMGAKFTTYLIEKDGYRICKKCGRELPYIAKYFPTDKTTKTGLRNVCRECNPKYYGFLPDDFVPQEKWSDEELKILEENYKDYTNDELIEKFFPNRTIRSVESQASVHGWSGKTDEAYHRGRLSQANAMMGRRIEMTEQWRNNISKSRKKYFETHDGWWKGRKRSKEQCAQISERMKGKWAGDKNPRHINPLNGENNGRWKGGINDTYRELRSETKDWQQESMEFCNYHCVITGGEFKNIHHTYPFRDIVDLTFENTNIDVRPKVNDYSVEDFTILRNEVKELHNCFGFGACLDFDVHKLFHDNYGYTKFNGYDFLDFVYRIDIGEFDNWFAENNLEININYDYIDYLENKLKDLEEAA